MKAKKEEETNEVVNQNFLSCLSFIRARHLENNRTTDEIIEITEYIPPVPKQRTQNGELFGNTHNQEKFSLALHKI